MTLPKEVVDRIPPWLCESFQGLKVPENLIDLESCLAFRDEAETTTMSALASKTSVQGGRPPAASKAMDVDGAAFPEPGTPAQPQSKSSKAGKAKRTPRKRARNSVGKFTPAPVPTVPAPRPQGRNARACKGRVDYARLDSEGRTSKEVLKAIRSGTDGWFADRATRRVLETGVDSGSVPE